MPCYLHGENGRERGRPRLPGWESQDSSKQIEGLLRGFFPDDPAEILHAIAKYAGTLNLEVFNLYRGCSRCRTPVIVDIELKPDLTFEHTISTFATSECTSSTDKICGRWSEFHWFNSWLLVKLYADGQDTPAYLIANNYRFRVYSSIEESLRACEDTRETCDHCRSYPLPDRDGLRELEEYYASESEERKRKRNMTLSRALKRKILLMQDLGITTTVCDSVAHTVTLKKDLPGSWHPLSVQKGCTETIFNGIA